MSRCLDFLLSLCGMPNYTSSDRRTSSMFKELRVPLSKGGCHKPHYSFPSDGQAERLNSIIGKSVHLALRSHNLPEKHWDLVPAKTLHSQRSLLCISTNDTPHEFFFAFQQRSSHGNPHLSWLMIRKPVLLKRFVRSNKNKPLVDQVELLNSDPTCARVRYSDG